MISSLALAAWVAIPAQLPIATEAQLPTGERAELSAEQLVYEPSKKLLTLRGKTELRTDTVLLRADELTYDEDAQRAAARGHVMLVAAGDAVAVADEVQVDVRTLEATVKGGVFMQKQNVDRARLEAAKTPEELKALGQTTLLIRGTKIRRIGPQKFAVEDLSFTPCDCNPSEPSWRIDAARADVEVGEKAILSWPKLYVYGVPVFALPWIYLPLGERRTGLLVPRPRYGPLTGFGLDLPVFVTLGPSWDLTLTPGYYAGAPQVRDAAGNLHPSPVGVAGPNLHTELRYAPAESTRGRAVIALLDDLRPRRDPVNRGLFFDGQRGLRGEATWQHAQNLGGGFEARVEASVVSDGYYPSDLQADILLKDVQYLRSTATLTRRTPDTFLGADLAYRQELSWGYSLFEADRDAAGNRAYGPNTLQRLPAFTFALPQRQLAGPIFGGITAELARIAPLAHGTGDEGQDGLFNPAAPDPGQGDRRFQPGEREARFRFDVMPKVSAELSAGKVARLTPYAAYREDLYAGELTGTFTQRGYPLLGAVADSELSRTFGKFRHAISPVAEVRFVPAVFGEPLGYYDEIDAAPATAREQPSPGRAELTASQPGFLQARVEVQQRLWMKQGTGARELARLDVGQSADLGYRSPPRLGDTYVRLGAWLDHFSADATARYDFADRRFDQISATVAVDDGRGDGAYARYDDLARDGSERLRAGIDALVGPSSSLPPGVPERSARGQLVVVGGHYRFGFGLALRYEAVVQPGFLGADPARPGDPLAQQVLGVSYGPACDCWRLALDATLRRGASVPEFGGTLTLGRFGTFGSAR